MAPCKVYNARDGKGMLIVIANDHQFEAMCRLLGHEEWATDPRYAKPAARVENRDELNVLFQSNLEEQDRAFWLDATDREGIACSSVNGVDDVATHPIFLSRMLGETEYQGRALKLVRSPILMDDRVLPIRSGPPDHGEHSEEILRTIGVNAEQFRRLREKGSV